MPAIAKRFAQLCVGVAASAGVPCAAAAAANTSTTYYVRTDGGSAEQCTGLADSAYPGRGNRQPCAWSHPAIALPPGAKPRIAGGDTLSIASGSYMVGIGVPESSTCVAVAAYDCTLARIPSGPTADRPTRILGTSNPAECKNAPQLWGTERVGQILDLRGSSNIEIGCLELTDHSDCIEFHCHGAQCSEGQVSSCQRDKAPFGQWASTGIYAFDSRRVWLHDLDIHGLAHTGIQAGRIGDWTLSRVRIRANGWVGWDGDLGKSTSSNYGLIKFQQVEIAWNGCGERRDGQIFGCWAQEEGGYGDGLGTAKTGGSWIFEDSSFHDNTSDGLDLLYADGTGTIVLRRVYSAGNAGNQVKLSGNATVEDSVLVGSCASFDAKGNMRKGDACRASGSSLSLNLGKAQNASVTGSDVRGEGDCLIEVNCAQSFCPGNVSVLIAHNRLAAIAGARAALKAPCSLYVEPALIGANIEMQDNRLYGVRSNECPKRVAECRDMHIETQTPPQVRVPPLKAS